MRSPSKRDVAKRKRPASKREAQASRQAGGDRGSQPRPSAVRLRLPQRRVQGAKPPSKDRAGDRARTGDSVLGKHVLYQLSYARGWCDVGSNCAYFQGQGGSTQRRQTSFAQGLEGTRPTRVVWTGRTRPRSPSASVERDTVVLARFLRDVSGDRLRDDRIHHHVFSLPTSLRGTPAQPSGYASRPRADFTVNFSLVLAQDREDRGHERDLARCSLEA